MEHTTWADIPLDLASWILRLLPAHVDHVRFAAVCPQWRAAMVHGPLPPPLPLLLLSDGTVYSLPGSNPFHFPGFMGYTDACGDWLVFSGEEGCFLRNPLSNATVTLPPLSRVRARLVVRAGGAIWTQAPPAGSTAMKHHHKGTITFTHRGTNEGGILRPPMHVGDESANVATRAWMRMAERLQLEEEPKNCEVWFCSPNFILATIEFTGEGRIAVCQAGATSWWSVYLANHCPYFMDMAFHQGKLYALNFNYSLFVIDISMENSSSDPWISQVREVINGPSLHICFPLVCRKRAYLVESRGVLLVVIRKLSHPWLHPSALYDADAAECREFEVFEADFSQSKWLKVATIGKNVVLFLRQRCSRSVCVSHNVLPGDCIFFLDNDDKECDWYGPSSSCSVYSMTEGKVSNPLPTVSWKRGMTFGTWFFPQN